MDLRRKTTLNYLNEYFQEVEQSLEKLKKELEIVKLERDMYKQELQECKDNLVAQNNVVHMTVYSEDNGEGVDTEVCIGVFTTKSNAIKAILDLCNKHDDLNSQSFNIVEFNVNKLLSSNDTVYVVQQDIEEHCEVSTNIIDVICENTINNNNHYTVEYKVDEVNFIEL